MNELIDLHESSINTGLDDNFSLNNSNNLCNLINNPFINNEEIFIEGTNMNKRHKK
jgi:hypothetical protein